MNEDEVDIFSVAVNNAILYGCGFIKIINTPRGMVVDVIEPEEYLEMSKALEWAASEIKKRPMQ